VGSVIFLETLTRPLCLLPQAIFRMKTLLSVILCSLAMTSARAQLFGPGSMQGALFGGLAGGIIGHNNANQTGRGVAIGVASGLILGALADSSANQAYYGNTQVPVPYAPDYPACTTTSYSPSTDYARPNYAVAGTLLGGLAGAIIGHNSGSLSHNGWQGAAIGAGAGLLLGGLAEQNARVQEAAAAPPVVITPAAPAAAPAPVTIINNNYNAPATPMSGANSLFGRN
jgi:uncharacterized protein YcfJ